MAQNASRWLGISLAFHAGVGVCLWGVDFVRAQPRPDRPPDPMAMTFSEATVPLPGLPDPLVELAERVELEELDDPVLVEPDPSAALDPRETPVPAVEPVEVLPPVRPAWAALARYRFSDPDETATPAPPVAKLATPPVADASTPPPEADDLPTVPPAPRADNPPPRYPRRARRLGQEGVVVVRVEVSASGRVLTASLVRSSGFGDLDRAAVQALRRWHFHPATRGEAAVFGVLDVPVRFRLTGTS